MNARARRYLPLTLAVVAMLFAIAGIAYILRWFPGSPNGAGNAPYSLPVGSAKAAPASAQTAQRQTESTGRPRTKCRECGLIVSVREIDAHEGEFRRTAAVVMTTGNENEALAKASTIYKIIVRMADGSSRVIHHANPASWRPGERVILIEGANPQARKLR